MKMRQSNLPKPTEGELELLRVLWVKGSATVRELHEAVSEERALGYTTVLKLLQIMTEKGLVERTEAGKAHIYHAAASQEETQNQLLRDLSERLFSGSAAENLRFGREGASEAEVAAAACATAFGSADMLIN